ncbi:MAG: lytic transglycosylase domain-containing protein [bacterium]|nr:lytic transglycosylase domain-containing protein [bacterium]
MNKRLIYTLVFTLMFISTSLYTAPNITVTQDKEGNISVSNQYKGHNFYTAKKDRVRFVSNKGSRAPAEYLGKIKRLARKHRVKVNLIVAVIRAESSFNPFAVSPKGAVGLMQLMPDTARMYGVFNRYNVDQNLEAGIRHLKYLYGLYKDIPLTLAAYNAGETAVAKYNGVPPYKETQTYVKRVMRYMGMGYSGFARRSTKKSKHRIYRVITSDGRVTITDSLPGNVDGTVSIID